MCQIINLESKRNLEEYLFLNDGCQIKGIYLNNKLYLNFAEFSKNITNKSSFSPFYRNRNAFENHTISLKFEGEKYNNFGKRFIDEIGVNMILASYKPRTRGKKTPSAVRFIKDDLYNSWNQYAMANGKAFKETAENKSDIIQAFSCLLGEFKEKIEKLLV